ncbi:DNA-binding barrel domain superfamily, partial [Sesbania bispinosa]
MSLKASTNSRMKKPRSEMNVDPDDPKTWYMPRWQFLEYDPRVGFCKVAAQFARDFWDIVPRQVHFIDGIGNNINVVVRRDVDDMYFTHGWPLLKDVYDLDDGGWIKLFYHDKDVFKIFVFDRDFIHVHLPIPPKEYEHTVTYIPEDIIPGYRESDFADVHYFDKTMTKMHANGRTLNLPTALCERFRTKITSAVLRDDNGVVFPVNLSWSRNGKVAYITKGWKQFSMQKNLKKDSV